MLGAFCFGAVVGWFLYFTNRYRKDVALADIATLIGAIGGAAITALFGKTAGPGLFAAYGAGLAVGFFGYLLALVVLVLRSPKEFTLAYLIDGRRADPKPGWGFGAGSQQPVRSFFARLPSAPAVAMRMVQPSPVAATPEEHSALDDQHAALAASIDASAQAIMLRYNAATDPTMRAQLTDQVHQLSSQRDKLDAAAIRADLSAPELQRAITQLTAVTQQIKDEAQNLSDATKTIATAAKVVSLVSQALGIIAMLG